MFIKNLIVLIFLCTITFSCSEISVTQQKLDPEVYYKNDIVIEDNNKKFKGIAILPQREEYKIKIKNYGKLDFLTIETCHREDTFSRPDKGVFKENGEMVFEYSPTIEKEKACEMIISAYNSKQRNGFGIILFENPEYQLEAYVECNGDAGFFTGIVGCESKEGLLQKIEFKEIVKISKPLDGPIQRSKPCPELKMNEDNKTLEFINPNRQCIYLFMGIESRKKLELFTSGYEEIIIRN